VAVVRKPNQGDALAMSPGKPEHHCTAVITEQPPLAYWAALWAVTNCAASTARLLWHAAFRAESLLNTPLFAGFPGLVSKLWLADDQRGRYRGLYEWDGPARAEAYARALWRVLALVSVPGSIHYVVLPGLRRDELLARPQVLADVAADAAAWWRLARIS
jgi:hypothetical protein